MVENRDRGAVEIIGPDEHVGQRLEAIMTVARACEHLAEALTTPPFTVNIHGNITANAEYGVKVNKKKG